MATNTSPQTLPNRVLVIGGSGKTGRRVIERLDALGVETRGVSRSSEPRFDWNDQRTWSAALDGVDAAYVTYYPDLAFPGARDSIGRLGAELAARGVRRMVLLSGRGEPEAKLSEEALLVHLPEATVVRAAFFMQDFSEYFLYDPVMEGVIALPAGDVAEPFVDAEDIADVVVSALTTTGLEGEVLDLTGPQLLTFAEVAAVLTAATGREIRYEPVTGEEYAAAAIAAGMPAEEVAPFVELFSVVLDGRNEVLGDGVQRALGRPPRAFADYARRTEHSGVWALPEQREAG